ncbi:hypothetical protein Z945_2192 [Sulfitobacter noctilucae]|nr:hypothetical protein Z945_2192 [Sulfitobacter noctilucae]
MAKAPFEPRVADAAAGKKAAYWISGRKTAAYRFTALLRQHEGQHPQDRGLLPT